MSLRVLVENLLGQTAADMRMQHEATSSALTLRIHETRDAKAGLEDQLSKVHIVSSHYYKTTHFTENLQVVNLDFKISVL